MSMLASSPTVVYVPDLFRETVLNSNPNALNYLFTSVATQSAKRTDDATILQGIVEAGWPLKFAEWYMDQVLLHGPYLFLQVTEKTSHEIEVDEHREIVKHDHRAAKAGALVAAALLAYSIVHVALTMRLEHNGDLDLYFLWIGAVSALYLLIVAIKAVKGRFR